MTEVKTHQFYLDLPPTVKILGSIMNPNILLSLCYFLIHSSIFFHPGHILSSFLPSMHLDLLWTPPSSALQQDYLVLRGWAAKQGA